MTKKNTKKALLLSVLSLVVCFSMLVGTTFAWFTDSVTSANNVIASGNLDVALDYWDGDSWEDATNVEIFDRNANWEPGYAKVAYLKISNAGSLALKYLFSINIVEEIIGTNKDGNDIKLSDYIQFGIVENVTAGKFDGDRAAAIAAVTNPQPLSEALTNQHGYASNSGTLEAKAEGDNENPNKVIAIVVWMPTDVGNEANHNGTDIPSINLSLNLVATQFTSESDAFDNQYDKDADFDIPPMADVVVSDGKWIETSTHGNIWMNTSLQFKPKHTYEEALEHPYGLYHADFVVTADKDIPAESVILPGYYAAYCDDYNNGKWVGLSSGDVIPAGTEIRLIRVLSDGMNADITVNYQDICKFGNDGTGFLCGVAAVDINDDGVYEAAGATITVELRLYETPAQGECAEGGGCKHPYSSCELGADKYVTVGTYQYTIPTNVEATNP